MELISYEKRWKIKIRQEGKTQKGQLIVKLGHTTLDNITQSFSGSTPSTEVQPTIIILIKTPKIHKLTET